MEMDHLERNGRFERRDVGGRELVVWLPAAYEKEPARRFPVVYFTDGDSVFEAETARGGVDLGADRWVSLLASRGEFPESIIVAIAAAKGTREDGAALRDVELSLENNGFAFLAEVAGKIVPSIDNEFRTLADSAARTLAGTGLGGLAALAGLLHYPAVFGRSIGLSTSFEDLSQSVPQRAGLLRWIADQKTLPAQGRAVLLYGAHGLDECYEPYHADLAALLRSHGWIDGRHFVIQQVPDGHHTPVSWRSQLGTALSLAASRQR